MTQREREILIASVSWTDKSLTVNEEKAFQAGARWADKTMIEKACEWLKFNTNWDDEWNDMGRNMNYGMIEEFRKTMEE